MQAGAFRRAGLAPCRCRSGGSSRRRGLFLRGLHDSCRTVQSSVMPFFRRKPRIDDAIYGRLMTSFGRVVDADPLIGGPARALAERVAGEDRATMIALDERLYDGATLYHLRLLAGAWIMAAEGSVP